MHATAIEAIRSTSAKLFLASKAKARTSVRIGPQLRKATRVRFCVLRPPQPLEIGAAEVATAVPCDCD